MPEREHPVRGALISLRRLGRLGLRLVAGPALLLGALGASCSSDVTNNGGDARLVVVLTSDMQIPKDITRVSVEVRRGDDPSGGPELLQRSFAGEDLKLPLPIAVPLNEDGEVPVFVRALAWQGTGDAAVLRVLIDRSTVVPAQGTFTLEVPLQWLCDGFGKVHAGGVSTTCPSGQTCIAGRCESNWVDPASLPPFDGTFDRSIACFDAVTCFDSAVSTGELDMATCTLPIPPSIEVGINVAMVLDSGPGVCEAERCWIVLDGFSSGGWSQQGDRIHLPPAVCDRLATGQIQGVAATTTCATKTLSQPVCAFRGSPEPMADAGREPPRRDCTSAQHECGGACVSNTSPSSCGMSCDACPRPRNGSATCDGASCGIRCDEGYRLCEDSCVSEASVETCGETCSACLEPDNGVARCVDGRCDFSCRDGYHACDDQCVHDSSPAACGTECVPCTTPKHGTPVCEDGTCDFKCNSGYHRCGNRCRSNNSVNSCGTSCSEACPVPANGSATCDGNSCGFTCNSGYHRCGNRCRSNNSVNSCGTSCSACPVPANGSATCNGTSCGFTCNSGYHKCGNQCKPNNSVNSCGTSCSACPVPANGSATCNGTSCGFKCASGYVRAGSQCVSQMSGCSNYTFEGRAYAVCSSAKTFSGASQACANAGWHLASVHSSSENKFLYQKAATPHWIGLRDINSEGSFSWVSAEAFTYGSTYAVSPWCGNQPDNAGGDQDCVTLRINISPYPACWDDFICGGLLPFICERE